MNDFKQLGLGKHITERLLKEGISVPTPVQESAIPKVFEGTDLIVQAMTGSGKTLSFILPILEGIQPGAQEIQALVVTPTRELALQITEETKRFSGPNVNVLAVYGGQDVEKQLKKLEKSVDIAIGTPGRILDHLRRGTLKLEKLRFLILDEADQMLHIGFLSEVEKIIESSSPERQTLLFSATMPEGVRKLAKKYIKNPEYLQLESTQGPAKSVKQTAVYTTDRTKLGDLKGIINEQRPFMAVIFCRTKRRAEKLADQLTAEGYSCAELHGDLSQAKREKVMQRFRKAEFQLLVATDIAARGLDVEGVTHVINYDIPLDAQSYVHRIGRTGRAGMGGVAITLISQKDKDLLVSIEKELQITINKKSALPNEKAVDSRDISDNKDKDRKHGDKRKLDKNRKSRQKTAFASASRKKNISKRPSEKKSSSRSGRYGNR
ncbi:DEAD/DEAH box helicase [Bacillus massilinigeriensis]|uniref:DEAD/DEAH box helicase n=1 Tax=Bacillus mediterraneensis TaxID=1805474 RepID=UPI0008F8E75D|nr:DEAD/DEAH box helicase [Bacillus mediterraneensis]